MKKNLITIWLVMGFFCITGFANADIYIFDSNSILAEGTYGTVVIKGDDTVVTLSEMITAKEQGIPGRENNQSEHARFTSEMSFLNAAIKRVNIGKSGGELFLRLFWKSQYEEFEDIYSEVGLGSQHMCSAINEIGTLTRVSLN